MRNKICLLILISTLSSMAFGQNTMNEGPQKDSTEKSMSPKEARKQKDILAKSLAPIEGKAIVYIMRPGTLGFALMMRLDCDTFLVGWVGVKSYLYTIIDPGAHVFKARSENEYDLKVILEPGKIYYLEEDARMGLLYARTKLSLLREEEGKARLSKCGLSSHNRYPQFPNSKDVERSPPKDTR